jgi:hypothetical protein
MDPGLLPLADEFALLLDGQVLLEQPVVEIFLRLQPSGSNGEPGDFAEQGSPARDMLTRALQLGPEPRRWRCRYPGYQSAIFLDGRDRL